MTTDPIPGVSDQRYFHLALLAPDKSSFSANWIWDNVRKDSPVRQGRYKKTVFPGGTVDFRTIEESNHFAASLPAREALSISRALCAYDIFICNAQDMFVLGTGYAALTRTVFGRLIRRQLLSKVSFLKPKLPDIIASFRVSSQDPGLPVRFTITGFNASLAGKNLRTLRLAGSDVFGSGLVDQIERWFNTRNRGDARTGTAAETKNGAFDFEAIRLKAVDSLTGAAASLNLVRDGSYKVWLRKSASNILEVTKAVSVLEDLDLFEATKEPPRWSEEQDV